jgi:hypothetical protein
MVLSSGGCRSDGAEDYRYRKGGEMNCGPSKHNGSLLAQTGLWGIFREVALELRIYVSSGSAV